MRKFLAFILLISSWQLYSDEQPKKIIYIVPGQWGNIFAYNSPIFDRDNCLAPIRLLQEEAENQGFELRQIYTLKNLEPFEYLLMFEVPIKQPYYSIPLEDLEQFPKKKLILFLWEPPSVTLENYESKYHEHFSKIYTWHDAFVDNESYFKLFYAVMRPMIPEIVNFKEKKFSTMIACNKQSFTPGELYTERKNLIQFYERNHLSDFDLYGKWWPASLKTYKGSIEKKIEVLKNYKFCFAYENIRGIPGYITEKIFDCFQAGCVPIYFGASNISDYIPENCFINREDFDTDEELYQFLMNISEEDYMNYISNIRKFLSSEQAKVYSIEHFVATIMALINGDNK